MSQNGKKSPVKIAILGCGAVTELCHLPALKYTSDVKISHLVDRNLSRAELLAERFGVENVAQDYANLADVDGVIIALPHHLHAPISIEFLNKKIPVLVEKPMALNLGESEAMGEAADKNKTLLQIGLMYRFCNGPRVVKRAISEGWLGTIERFDAEWGFVYDWPIASGFFFDKKQAGGGVLMDFGSHVLDLLVWWFGDQVNNLTYRDDNMGGVEAECEIEISFKQAKGDIKKGNILLSRLRQLDDRIRIVGEHLTMECDLYTPDIVRIWPNTPNGADVPFKLDFDSIPRQSLDEAYAEQLMAFARAIRSEGEAAVSGREVLKSMALIDQCYKAPKPIEFPWQLEAPKLQEAVS